MNIKRKITSVNWSKVDAALAAAAVPFSPSGAEEPSKRDLVFPGAVLRVMQGGEVLYHSAVGCRSRVPEPSPMHKNVVFDVGALTRPLVASTLTMQLIQRGQLELDKRLSHIFQTFGVHGKERMTVRHLLNHTSGYAATAPYYRQIANADRSVRAGMMTSRGAVDAIYNEIFRAKLENLPGKVSRESDIGFILLGYALEVVSGTTFEKLIPKLLLKRFELPSTGFIELSSLRGRRLETVNDIIAPTAECPWRGKLMSGEVYDDNAWAMGGVSAHAGLFTTAEDIQQIASTLIECYHGRGQMLSPELVKEFWSRKESYPPGSWALGWNTAAVEEKKPNSCGQYFSSNSVGHDSATGCSLWIDPERELSVVLLSNAIHPHRDSKAIREFRPVLHDLVMESLGYV